MYKAKLAALFFAILTSQAVVHSQKTVPNNISACIAPPSGQATFTILGQQGPAGPPGSVGPKGNEGGVGKQGVKGERGVKGDEGVRGEAGLVGMKGLSGLKGEKGKHGVSGPVGPQGNPGLPGAIGPRGRQGVDGARGHPGDDGPHGPPGPPGLAGVRGSPGPEGSTGTCNFSGPAYQKLTKDIRANLTEEIRKEIEIYYILTPSPCISYNTGSTGLSQNKPASSCKYIYQCSLSTAPSGYYWITTSNGTTKMYCAMNLTHCGNTAGGWTRVAYINMTDPTETCPGGLSYISSPTRMCGQSTSGSGCSSVTLPAYEGSYTKVCGRALGYQYYVTAAFYSYHYSGQSTLDDYYVDGVSVTYGNPRHHVWTFGCGSSKDEKSYYYRCPCAPPTLLGNTSPPPFVGNHSFCESGATGRHTSTWYLDDPLWDGKGCAEGSTCCDGSNRPWFYRELNNTVTESVEVRMCLVNTRTFANIGVEELEIYVS